MKISPNSTEILFEKSLFGLGMSIDGFVIKYFVYTIFPSTLCLSFDFAQPVKYLKSIYNM